MHSTASKQPLLALPRDRANRVVARCPSVLVENEPMSEERKGELLSWADTLYQAQYFFARSRKGLSCSGLRAGAAQCLPCALVGGRRDWASVCSSRYWEPYVCTLTGHILGSSCTLPPRRGPLVRLISVPVFERSCMGRTHEQCCGVPVWALAQKMHVRGSLCGHVLQSLPNTAATAGSNSVCSSVRTWSTLQHGKRWSR
jgi:hypothetical protein